MYQPETFQDQLKFYQNLKLQPIQLPGDILLAIEPGIHNYDRIINHVSETDPIGTNNGNNDKSSSFTYNQQSYNDFIQKSVKNLQKYENYAKKIKKLENEFIDFSKMNVELENLDKKRLERDRKITRMVNSADFYCFKNL